MIAGSLAALAAIIACILWVDQPLALFMKAHVDGGLETLFRGITHTGRAELYLVPSGLLALIWWKKPQLRHRALFVFTSLASSGLSELALKFVFGRFRPIRLFQDNLFGFDWFQHGWTVNSFPSGHAQAIFAAMGALAVLWPRWAHLFFFWAALVAASRVVLTAHYLSDVIAGAWLSLAWLAFLVRRFGIIPPGK